MNVVIHKTVSVEGNRRVGHPDDYRGQCPFCVLGTLRVFRSNADTDWWYVCFHCGAGGSVCVVMPEDDKVYVGTGGVIRSESWEPS